MKAAAVAAARRGWCVFPCRPNDKRPTVDQWEQRAVADPDKVARYWPSPRHNVGVACGPSKLVVIDLDTPKGRNDLPPEWAAMGGVREGADVLTVLMERAGVPVKWPETYTVTTPTSGTHLYFKAIPGKEIRNSQGKLGPMIDVRAAGGYVVGGGSVTTAGSYEVICDADPVPLPGWIAEALTRRPERKPPPERSRAARGTPMPRLRGIVNEVLTAPPRQGNGLLHWAACRGAELIAAGEVDEATVSDVLLRAAMERGRPEGEARRTIASGLKGAR